MRENVVKARLRNGEPVYGVLTAVYDPAMVESWATWASIVIWLTVNTARAAT